MAYYKEKNLIRIRIRIISVQLFSAQLQSK